MKYLLTIIAICFGTMALAQTEVVKKKVVVKKAAAKPVEPKPIKKDQ